MNKAKRKLKPNTVNNTTDNYAKNYTDCTLNN